MQFDPIGFNVGAFAAARQGGGPLWIGAFGPPPGPLHLAFSATRRMPA